jgi:tetratricopeptide (TPR) repeat protein
MRYYRLGLKRPGHDSKRWDALLQYLANCETAMGNLREAKRLAAENYVNPTFPFRIAYYEGDWKAAANALEKALNSRRSIGAAWDELIELSHAVDLWRVTGDYPGAVAALECALSLCEPDDLYWGRVCVLRPCCFVSTLRGRKKPQTMSGIAARLLLPGRLARPSRIALACRSDCSGAP